MRLRVTSRQLEILRKLSASPVSATEAAACGHVARIYRGLLARAYATRTPTHLMISPLGLEVLRRHPL